MSKSKLIDLKERIKLLLSRNKKSNQNDKESKEILLNKLEKRINDLEDNLPEFDENQIDNKIINTN